MRAAAGQWPENRIEYELSEDAALIPAGSGVEVSKAGEGRYRLAGHLQNIQQGRVLVCTVGEGFIGRVDSVEQVGDGAVEVSVGPATLEEALQRAELWWRTMAPVVTVEPEEGVGGRAGWGSCGAGRGPTALLPGGKSEATAFEITLSVDKTLWEYESGGEKSELRLVGTVTM